jgi:hypothetical protein
MDTDNLKELDEFEIPINNQYLTTTIKGFEKFKEFISDQRKKWDEVQGEASLKTSTTNLLNKLLGRFNSFNKDEKDLTIFSKNLEELKKYFLETCKRDAIVWNGNENGKFIYDLIKSGANDTQIEGATNFILDDKRKQLPTDRDSLIGFIKAYEFFHNDSVIFKRSESEKENLASLEIQFKKTIENSNEKLNKKVEAVDKLIEENKNKLEEIVNSNGRLFDGRIVELNDIIKKAEEKIKELEDLYKDRLRYDAAVNHWRKRAFNYKRGGIIWLIFLCLTSGALIYLLSYYFFNYPSTFFPKGDKFDYFVAFKGTFILLTIISFGAYLIRVFSKLTFSSFHLSRDAEEREQLTHIYLALKKDHPTLSEQEPIIIQSLFSRVDTGMLGGDHSPTMPAAGMIEKMTQSGSKT